MKYATEMRDCPPGRPDLSQDQDDGCAGNGDKRGWRDAGPQF